MAEALNDQDPQQQHDETPPDPLEEVRRERDALQDRLLRTAAEFDNYRKHGPGAARPGRLHGW